MLERIDLPEKLKPVYFDFHWSQKKLWALELPEAQMNVSDFLWSLDYPIWATNPPEKIFDLEPNTVLKNLEHFPLKKERIQQADLSYPIHVMYWKNRWVILDGYHRLLKKILLNEKSISVKIVPHRMIPAITPDPVQATGFFKYQKTKTS